MLVLNYAGSPSTCPWHKRQPHYIENANIQGNVTNEQNYSHQGTNSWYSILCVAQWREPKSERGFRLARRDQNIKRESPMSHSRPRPLLHSESPRFHGMEGSQPRRQPEARRTHQKHGVTPSCWQTYSISYCLCFSSSLGSPSCAIPSHKLQPLWIPGHSPVWQMPDLPRGGEMPRLNQVHNHQGTPKLVGDPAEMPPSLWGQVQCLSTVLQRFCMAQTILDTSVSSTGSFLPPQLVSPFSWPIHSSSRGQAVTSQSLNEASDGEKQPPAWGKACILNVSGEGHQSSEDSLGSLSPSALMVYPWQDALIFCDTVIDSRATAPSVF